MPENTYPIKPHPYASWGWLRQEVGAYLGFGYDYATWDHLARGQVLSVLQSGMMNCYFPPPLETEVKVKGGTRSEAAAHSWSFLAPVREITISSTDGTALLPEDFTGIIGDITWIDQEDSHTIGVVSEEKLRQIINSDPRTATARYAAIQVVNTGNRIRHKLIVYPTPTADDTFEYRSTIVPPALSEETDYSQPIYGPPQLAELMLASCLSVAEQRKGAAGMWTEKFIAQLKAALAVDVQSMRPTSGEIYHLGVTGTGLAITRHNLKELIGRQLGYGPHDQAWNHSQSTEVQIVLNRGLRQFYDPVQVDSAYTHEWSFLRPHRSINTVADVYKYELPDFQMLFGPITFAPGQSMLYVDALQERPLYQVRQLLQSDTTGRPAIYGLHSYVEEELGGVQWELWLAPIPDQAYELVVPYRVNPFGMIADGALPYGGPTHSETIIESCLAAAEAFQEKKGVHYEMFLKLLAASISRDRKNISPDTMGYNHDPSDRLDLNWRHGVHCGNSTITYNGSEV